MDGITPHQKFPIRIVNENSVVKYATEANMEI